MDPHPSDGRALRRAAFRRWVATSPRTSINRPTRGSGARTRTILAHHQRSLYGKKVSELEQGRLRPMVEAARSETYGMYPDYEFGGVRKKAAFYRLKSDVGLEWVIGVGVEQQDFAGPVTEVAGLLLWASLVALLLGCAVAWAIAHRFTAPVIELRAQAKRVAEGDLDARVPVRGKDEVAQLSESFNAMAHDLAENRDRLIRAEKESAWREMALQVAHEIKNPLTPIRLSTGLLRRAWNERRDEFEPLLNHTLDMIDRQVDSMREVTQDFSAFAGGAKRTESVAAGPLLAEALENAGVWADENGVQLHTSGLELVDAVRVHRGDMLRALANLIANALEAMPSGGELHAHAALEGDQVRFTIRDTGAGIPAEALPHLFEPHFTTRSAGTGLGLAIVKRVVEARGGKDFLRNSESGVGAIAEILLPGAPRLADC
ncbi:MAG: ATP-binding protein [Planctomycetota bacterium]